MKAILADHDELAQSLLELSRRWLLNLADHEGRSAFMLACAAGQPMLAVVRDLLACPGVDVNQRDNKGRTALLVAASRDEREVLQLLLTTSGIDANLSDSTGNTALIAASRAGHTAIVEMLLGCNKKLDFNSRSGPQGYTALMWACEEGRADIVRLLTSRQQEIDANIASADGSTALMLASKSMFADCVKALLTWSKVDLLRKDQVRFHTFLCSRGLMHVSGWDDGAGLGAHTKEVRKPATVGRKACKMTLKQATIVSYTSMT